MASRCAGSSRWGYGSKSPWQRSLYICFFIYVPLIPDDCALKLPPPSHGLQDHIVAGTLMTMKDRFLTQSEYCQLIYECVAQDCSGSWEVWLDEPAVLKPQKLWTGKQVGVGVCRVCSSASSSSSINCS